jgi:hypothetical protein
MRHLALIDVSSALRRGRSVEQFLGQSPASTGFVRHVELRPSGADIELWIYDVEDIGSEDYSDLYGFPYLEQDGSHSPVATFRDSFAAIEHARQELSASPSRWVNLGVAESEYLDYIRAGRPSGWPVAA